MLHSQPVHTTASRYISILSIHFSSSIFVDKQNAVALSDKPWHCLVSYVDDLTVGGRRNSKGLYDDPMLFPSFGKRKAPKVPDDCFPQKCYER